MALDLNRLQQKQADSALSGSRWKPKGAPTQNFIRVFKFGHVVTKADVAAGLFTADKVGKAIEDFDRSVVMQFGFTEKKKPILATKETLARYEKLSSSSNANNVKAAEAIKPSKKYLMNVVDMSEKPRKMRHWAAPATAYNDILAVIMNPEFGEAVLGSAGRDFIVTFDKSQIPQQQYKVQLRDKDKSIKLDPGLEKKVNDFYSEAGLKEAGLSTKATAAPAPEAEETEEVEEEVAEEATEEAVEETTEEAVEETTEEGEEGAETEPEEPTEESAEEVTEEPEEEPAEEPAKPVKKAAPAKKLPPKKGKK